MDEICCIRSHLSDLRYRELATDVMSFSLVPVQMGSIASVDINVLLNLDALCTIDVA
jgi:hypothetical protein